MNTRNFVQGEKMELCSMSQKIQSICFLTKYIKCRCWGTAVCQIHVQAGLILCQGYVPEKCCAIKIVQI